MMNNMNQKFNFYAGQLDEKTISQEERNGNLYEFETDLLENEVSFSAFGDGLTLSGSGILIDDPAPVLRVDLNKDKSTIRDAKANTNYIENDQYVFVGHVKSISERQVYYTKEGKQKIHKNYGIVPIFANNNVAKKILSKFGKGDHINFSGALITNVLQAEDGSYTNKATFWCILRNFSGNPTAKIRRAMKENLNTVTKSSSNMLIQDNSVSVSESTSSPIKKLSENIDKNVIVQHSLYPNKQQNMSRKKYKDKLEQKEKFNSNYDYVFAGLEDVIPPEENQVQEIQDDLLNKEFSDARNNEVVNNNIKKSENKSNYTKDINSFNLDDNLKMDF